MSEWENWDTGLSHNWKIVLAFFLGGAVADVAQDASSYIFFWAQANSYNGFISQTVTWYWIPFGLYVGFFLLGLGLARLGFKPESVIYIYLAMVVASAALSFGLPQFQSPVFGASVILATMISVGIVFGVKRQVET